jgi:hypothetical protein
MDMNGPMDKNKGAAAAKAGGGVQSSLLGTVKDASGGGYGY